jgi:hypothetical protein
MSKFIRSEFSGGESISYQGKFVARFKHQRGDKAGFISFLIKNFSVEEYFTLLETLPPLKVLETKGFLLPRLKKVCVLEGFEPTLEGFKQMIDARVAAYYNKG